MVKLGAVFGQPRPINRLGTGPFLIFFLLNKWFNSGGKGEGGYGGFWKRRWRLTFALVAFLIMFDMVSCVA